MGLQLLHVDLAFLKKMDKLLIISVVRDWTMYETCLGKNPQLRGCHLIPVDNRETNEFIPVCYNRVLDALTVGQRAWLVFCHEDFQPLEDITATLAGANPERIYGPIGGRLVNQRPWLLGGLWPGVFAGQIETCDKDGGNVGSFGVPVESDTCVDTVDCQCLIVHSSLVERHRLRFDERLSFDLYAEDFCLGARLMKGVETAILPFRCRHWSRGTVLPRFFEQKAYLDAKYPKAEAFGCVGHTIGGGRTWMRRRQKGLRRFLDEKMPWAVPLLLKVLI